MEQAICSAAEWVGRSWRVVSVGGQEWLLLVFWSAAVLGCPVRWAVSPVVRHFLLDDRRDGVGFGLGSHGGKPCLRLRRRRGLGLLPRSVHRLGAWGVTSSASSVTLVTCFYFQMHVLQLATLPYTITAFLYLSEHK